MAEELEYHEQREGWTHEWLQDKQCICFMRPREIGGGFVIVDFERRIFSCGYGKPREGVTDTKYEGRGWKDRIIQDAIAHLESIMSDAGGKSAQVPCHRGKGHVDGSAFWKEPEVDKTRIENEMCDASRETQQHPCPGPGLRY